MKNDDLRILRMYCNLDAEEIAKLASVPLERYLRFENGEDALTEAEEKKLSSIFNLKDNKIENTIDKTDKFNVNQELESYLFPEQGVTDFSKVQLTDLSPVEKRLILTLRQCKHKNNVVEKIFDIILEDVE